MRITTTYSNLNGKGRITARAQGKQRTVGYDHGLSKQANHASAVGALMAVLCTPEEKAKVLHPSGGQRVRMAYLDDPGVRMRTTIAL